MLPSQGSPVHAGLWEDQHKALQREVQLSRKLWYVCPRARQEKGSSQISGVLWIQGENEVLRQQAEEKKKKKKLQAHLGFYSTNRHHQWHNMLDQTCQKDSKLLEADHSTFCDAMREKQELSWTKITHIFLSFQLPVFLFFTLSCVKLSH